MLLNRGITGFFDVNSHTLNENDFITFKKILYSIHINEWNLIEICNPNNTNYFYANFTYNGHNLYILLNKYYPIIAFTNELTLNEKLFIDISESLIYFSNYDVVGAETLNSEFTNYEHNLSKIELEQIKYWNPISVGNIIFNEWD